MPEATYHEVLRSIRGLLSLLEEQGLRVVAVCDFEDDLNSGEARGGELE